MKQKDQQYNLPERPFCNPVAVMHHIPQKHKNRPAVPVRGAADKQDIHKQENAKLRHRRHHAGLRIVFSAHGLHDMPGNINRRPGPLPVLEQDTTFRTISFRGE